MYDVPKATSETETTELKIKARGVQVYYGDTHAIKDVDVDISDKTVTAFIGPSGCGKSTFLRCINRMNDTIDIARIEGYLLGFGAGWILFPELAMKPLPPIACAAPKQANARATTMTCDQVSDTQSRDANTRSAACDSFWLPV